MLGSLQLPKVVTVRVQKAENLQIVPKSEKKSKKPSQKWKVKFLGGKKSMSTDSVLAPAGNPVWDSEVTMKLTKGESLVLLVTDSDDHHAGQVVISPHTIPPRPSDHSERPTDPSRLKIVDLEGTKKVETNTGTLYFWVWVEEYRSKDEPKKGFRGSVLSVHHSKKKNLSSSTNDLPSGSILSIGSSQLDARGVKKSRNPFKRHSKKNTDSISGAPSALNVPNPENRSHRPPGDYYDPLNPSNFNSSQAPSQPTLSPRIPAGDSTSEERRPILTHLKPTSCPTEGDTEIIVHGSGLTEANIRNATVLIDDKSIPRTDWFVKESRTEDPNQFELHIQMPPHADGRCFIQLETTEFGRIRCPQEFKYIRTPSSDSIQPVDNRDMASDFPHSQPHPNPVGSSPLVRNSSVRNSLLVRDRRSVREKKRNLEHPNQTSDRQAEVEKRDTDPKSSEKPEGLHDSSDTKNNGVVTSIHESLLDGVPVGSDSDWPSAAENADNVADSRQLIDEENDDLDEMLEHNPPLTPVDSAKWDKHMDRAVYENDQPVKSKDREIPFLSTSPVAAVSEDGMSLDADSVSNPDLDDLMSGLDVDYAVEAGKEGSIEIIIPLDNVKLPETEQSPTDKSEISQSISVVDSGIGSTPGGFRDLGKVAEHDETLQKQPRKPFPDEVKLHPSEQQGTVVESPKSISHSKNVTSFQSSSEASESDDGSTEKLSWGGNQVTTQSKTTNQSEESHDDDARFENAGLRAMLNEANLYIERLKKQTVELEKELSAKSADVDRLSSELCNLRNRLLEHGQFQYLEKPISNTCWF